MPPQRPEIDDDTTLGWDASHTSFTQIPDWILRNREINDAALRTWLAIASFADNKSRGAFPKVKTLAEMRGKGRSQIFDHLQQLERAGLIVRRAQYYDDGRRRNNHYVLAWASPFTTPTDDAEGPRPENRTGANTTESPRPENRTPTDPGPEIRTAPRTENRATRTTPITELDPPTPQRPSPDQPRTTDQGAAAPRTPRSRTSPNGRRAEGTNPRAVRATEDQDARRATAMRNWARNMNIPGFTLDDFAETVAIELRAGKITQSDADLALDEARHIRGINSHHRVQG